MRTAALLVTVVLLLAGTPWKAMAALVIHEVAWMGTADNPNAEWIELANSGNETIDLSGWKLVSSTGSPAITIAGSVAGNGYYLLTRTSTSILPGVTGDQAYTGALSNAGATLVLQDASGNIVDEAVGGTNWTSLGGSNTTKETAQRVGSGWVTAQATPRAANTASQAEEEEDDDDNPVTPEPEATTPETTIGGSSTTSGVGVYAFPKLFISAGPNREVTALAETPFRAFVFDDQAKPRRDVHVTWSFGDGARRNGFVVRHAYEAPGEYLVVVRAAHRQATAIRTLLVRVAPAAVAIAGVSDVGITVVNRGTDILDLSNWELFSAGKHFTIPEDTALLPGRETLFPASVTKLATSTDEVLLAYPSGRTAALFKEVPAITAIEVPRPFSTKLTQVPEPLIQEAVPAPGEPLGALLWGFAKQAVTSLF